MTNYEIVYLYKILIVASLYALPQPEPKPNISFSRLVETLRSSVAQPCDSMKNVLGLSYDQVQSRKNTTGIIEALNLDEVTANGNVKYNMAHRTIHKLVEGAETVVILIHGYLESSDGYMVSSIGPSLLKKKRYKILALDESKVIGIEYLRSSTYARFSGENLGTFLATMINHGLDPARIMLVGHSLGSHVAGAAGKQVKRLTGRQIGQITALDPARPCFGGDANGRIDRGDADYVEVIHTNGGGLGFKEPIGDRDFYPNGGKSQPGCLLATCAHSRAWLFYAEAVADPYNFPGRKCDSWEKFKEGSCSKKAVAYMGMSFVDLKKTNNQTIVSGNFFLSTAADTPFGLGLQGSKP